MKDSRECIKLYQRIRLHDVYDTPIVCVVFIRKNFQSTDKASEYLQLLPLLKFQVLWVCSFVNCVIARL